MGAVIGLVPGYAIGTGYVEPPDFIRSLAPGVVGETAAEPAANGVVRLRSVFLPLDAEWVQVAVSRPGRGGGLASFGQDVLLLTHDGIIYAARPQAGVRPTRLSPPDNGFEKLAAATQSGRLKGVQLDLTRISYHDILYFQSDSQRGLAVSYTDWDDEQSCYTTVVATLPLDPEATNVDELSSRQNDWRRLFSTRPCLPLKSEWGAIQGQMAGARMAFDPPRTLLLTSGDYGWDGMYGPDELAQDSTNDYGKFIAIDLESGEGRHVTMGHRNPQGIAFDAEGQLWGLEHGPNGGDELNRIVEGANYGWPVTSLGNQYSRLPLPHLKSSYGRHDVFTAPAYAWLPSVGASNLTLVTNFHPAWNGDLLAASLTRASLFRIHLDGQHVSFAEEIPVGERIRYVHQHSDGRLVLWTDSGRLLFVSVSVQPYAEDVADELIEDMQVEPGLRNAVRTVWNGCLECHSLAPGADPTSPTLSSVFENPVASTDYALYSRALRDVGGLWTRARIRAFLLDPSSVAPGTTMPKPGISDPDVLEAVIDLLEGIKNTVETDGAWADLAARAVTQPR